MEENQKNHSREFKWYVVHTYSGFENKVKTNLEERVKALHQQDLFGRILVPTEQVIELKKGHKKTSSRKFYPGYIMVQMVLNKDTWHTVRNTAKVTGFIGGGTTPAPVPNEEAERIIIQME
jgi:transcriptional antiterminator NusG